MGTPLRVSILLPDHAKALPIESGMIKWADGRLFGMEFQHLPLGTGSDSIARCCQTLIHFREVHSGRPGRSSDRIIIPRY